MTERLGVLLASTAPRRARLLDFVNASLPGSSSFESLGRLSHRLRFYRPDVIVVYHGWNDLYYFRAEQVEEIERSNSVALRTLVRLPSAS